MPEVEFLPNPRPRLFVCLPGSNFSFQWLATFLELFLFLDKNFELTWAFSTGCNIYDTRNAFVPYMKQAKPDYVLWVDSDNQVNIAGFKKLFDKLFEEKDIPAIGAWYLINKPGQNTNSIAAGDMNKTREITNEDLQKSAPIEVDYIGFGFLLMRYEIVERIAKARPDVFRPRLDDHDRYLGDDVSFCLDARDLGYKFFLHPQVYSPHLKTLPVGFVQSAA